MRFSGKLCGVFALALLLVACISISPSSTASKFYRHLDAGNTEGALALIATSVVNAFGREKVLSGLKQGAEQIDAKQGISQVEIKDEKIEDEKARVQLTIHYGNGETENETLSLINENGTWKLTLSK